MADVDETATPRSGGDLGSLKAWLDFADGELKLEQQRTSETRQRADVVIRNSALLLTLVTGITGSPKLFQREMKVPPLSLLLLGEFALVLFVAIGFAVAATWNISSKFTDSKSISSIPDLAWEDTEPAALMEILRQPATNLPSLREANTKLVELLGISQIVFAAALPWGFATMVAVLLR